MAAFRLNSPALELRIRVHAKALIWRVQLLALHAPPDSKMERPAPLQEYISRWLSNLS